MEIFVEVVFMDDKKFDSQVQDLTLALLYLTRFREQDLPYWRSWKGHDFDALNALSDQKMIGDSRHRSKSVVLTEDGIRKAKEILSEFRMVDPWGDE